MSRTKRRRSSSRNRTAMKPPHVKTTDQIASPRPQQKVVLPVSESARAAYYVPLMAVLGVLGICGWLRVLLWFPAWTFIDTPFYTLGGVEGYFDSPQVRGATLIFTFLALAWGTNCWLISRASNQGLRAAGLVALLTGAAGNLVALLFYPTGAVDVFFYLCELKLTYFYGHNPYTTTFSPLYQSDPFARFSIYLDSTLPYGPAWALMGVVPAKLGGFATLWHALLAYRVWSLLFVAMSAWLISLYHDDARRKWLGATLLAANPLVWYEGIVNAHNDIIMGAWLLAAALAMKRRSAWALPLLAVAVLVKQSAAPLAYVFLVWMLREKWPLKTMLLSLGGAVLLTVLVVAPFWAGGAFVAGMRHALSVSQGLNTPSWVSLATLYLSEHGATPEAIARMRQGFLLAFVAFTLASPWLFRVWEHALFAVFMSTYLMVGAMFPWYLLPAVGILALRAGRLELCYLVPACLFALLFDPLGAYAWHHSGWPVLGILWRTSLFETLPIALFMMAAAWYSWRTKGRPLGGRGTHLAGKAFGTA